MELIVDGKNVLEPVNLEKNKNEIMRQRASVPSQVSLTHFKENVGLFRANVKGDDLNGLVTELQNTFSDINIRETKMYDQLDTVFKTVESIHKGSIEGVIVGVKSAQEAISQAEYAIEKITETLVILQNFKEQLEDNTEHLNDIDLIWDATQQLGKDIRGLEKSLSQKAKSIEENIIVLMSIKSMLDEIKHIKDIDTMYKDLSSICKKFDQEKKKTSGRIDTISEGIQQLETFKESVEKIVHLQEVDDIYIKLTKLQKTVEAESGKVAVEIGSIQKDITGLAEFKHGLEKSEHLKDIDVIWKNNENLASNVIKLEKSVASNSDNIQNMAVTVQGIEEFCNKLKKHAHLTDIDTIWQTVQQDSNEIDSIKQDMHNVKVLENEVVELKGRIIVLYYALGGAVGVLILQIILNVIGIL